LGADALKQWKPCDDGSDVGGGLWGSIDALALSGSSLYVGGTFNNAGGVPSIRIAHWKAANLPRLKLYDTWVPVGTNAINARVVVTVCPLPAEPINIEYSTSNDTATAGVHYAPVSGVLSFSNSGPSQQEITVPVFGSPHFFSPEKKFTVRLSTTNALVHSGFVTNCYIYSSLPRPSISIDNVSLSEGDASTTPFNFTVSLSAPFADSLNVPLQFQNDTAIAGIDYLATPTNIVIPGGTSPTTSVI